MRMRFGGIVVLFLLASLCPSAFGATYYVATNGNDGWPGSSSQPWLTLQKAVNTVVAGDTVIVRSGNYAGFRITDKGGTSGSPITLQSETVGGANVNALGSGLMHGGMMEFEASYGSGIGYWVIDGFSVDGTVQAHDTYHVGVDMRGMRNMTVKNCTVHDCFKTGIFPAFADYAFIQNNTSRNNGEHGIYNCNSCDYGTNRLNTNYSNTGNGIQCNADVSAGGDGIMSGWLLERNTLYSNANGYNFPGLVSSTVRNSLIYDNTSKGFSLYGGEGTEEPHNMNLLNNTVVMPSAGYYAIFMLDDGKAVKGLGNRIFNNILYHYGDANGRGSICVPSTWLSDFQSDYNAVGNWFGIDDNATTLQLAAWRSTYGLDIHSIQAADTALFVNPSGKDFHLLSNSPAKDAGVTRADVTDDRDGNSRPQGAAYDIGCYELLQGTPLQITTSSLPNGTVGVSYNQTMTATGGTTPYTWAISSGSLPSGLSLVASTGAITGTPSTAGTSNFTARVTDNVAATATKALSIIIAAGGQQNVTFQDGVNGYAGTTDAWLNSDYPTTNYGADQTAHLQYSTQDRQVHRFDVSSIPSSATVNSATISFYVYSVTGGTPAVACYRVLTQWDEMQATYNNRLTSTAWGTPGLLSGTDYAATAIGTATVSAAGWVSYDITSTVQGWVNGTYANQGVMYKETSAGHCYTRMSEYTTDTTQRPKLVVTYTPGSSPLSITTTSLAGGEVGIAYSQTLAATGGTTPYTWAISSGNLPSGLSLNASSGAITGTPSASGTSSFTARVTDNVGATATKALSIVIVPAVSITTASLPNGSVGVAYNQTLAVTGGTTPYTWAIQSGSLPSGLSLNTSTGAITGTPTTNGTSNFTVKVTDAVTSSATKALSIVITSAPTYQFTASDSEANTTSTAWQIKATLSFTPSAADDWIIFGFAEYKGSSTSQNVLARLTVDATTQCDVVTRPASTSDYMSFMAVKYANLSAAAHTITIDYRSGSASATARIRNARVCAVRKAALLTYNSAADSTYALTTTLTDYGTVSWTPATAGTYAAIWFAEFSGNTSYDTQVQARLNGGSMDDVSVRVKNNADYLSYFSVTELTCDTTQQTLSIAAAKQTGSGATHNIRRVRLIAIRLTDGRFANDVAQNADTESSTTSTTFVNKLTKTWNWGNNGNWLLLTSSRLTNTNVSYQNEARVQVNASLTSGQPMRKPNVASGYVTAGSVDVRSLTTSRTLTIDYRSTNAAGSAKIRTVRFMGLPLD